MDKNINVAMYHSLPNYTATYRAFARRRHLCARRFHLCTDSANSITYFLNNIKELKDLGAKRYSALSCFEMDKLVVLTVQKGDFIFRLILIMLDEGDQKMSGWIME